MASWPSFSLRQRSGDPFPNSRVEWDAYDLVADIHEVQISIGVKSSSRLQTWSQRKHSTPQFRIAPTRKWDSAVGKYSAQRLKADIYVFGVFAETSVVSHEFWRISASHGVWWPRHASVAVARPRREWWAPLPRGATPPQAPIHMRGVSPRAPRDAPFGSSPCAAEPSAGSARAPLASRMPRCGPCQYSRYSLRTTPRTEQGPEGA